MADNNNSRETAEIVESALKEFRKGMEYREQLSIRIGRRTTQIIRFGMAGLSILGLALFYLISILTKDFAAVSGDMERIAGHIKTMEASFTSVAGNINAIQRTLVTLNDNITVMPAINTAVGNMDDSLVTLSGDLHSIVDQIYTMNGSVSNMAANIQLLNRQLIDMNISVGSMSGNVHQMAKPMKMFPFQ